MPPYLIKYDLTAVGALVLLVKLSRRGAENAPVLLEYPEVRAIGASLIAPAKPVSTLRGIERNRAGKAAARGWARPWHHGGVFFGRGRVEGTDPARQEGPAEPFPVVRGPQHPTAWLA